MAKTVNKLSTKTEILDAYESLLGKIQEEKQESPKETKLAEAKQASGNIASSLSEENILKGITNLKLDITRSLDTLEKSLVEEHKKLSSLKEATANEKQSLENLYGIVAETDSLAALLLAQKEKKEAFDKELNEKKEAFDKEISEKRQNWDKEKTIHELTLKEEKEKTAKERKREEEEYTYTLTIKRKKDEDTYNEKKSALDKALIEKQQTFDKEYKEREQTILSKETEYSELKIKVEKFPDELQKAIKQSEIEVTDRLTSQFKFEKEILQKDYSSEVKLKEQQILALENKIKDLEIQLKQAMAKTETSEKNLKDVVMKTIEQGSRIAFVDKPHAKETD